MNPPMLKLRPARLPPPFSWLWKGWMLFAETLGKIMSWIILTILWIVVFGIYGIIMKVVMLFKMKKVDMYWVDPPKEFENSMRYQF